MKMSFLVLFFYQFILTSGFSQGKRGEIGMFPFFYYPVEFRYSAIQIPQTLPTF
jgi:hypothetical protein